MLRVVSLSLLALNVAGLPVFPTEFTAVVQMNMPYIPMVMNMRVLTSLSSQKIEYYDGLEIDVSNANGSFKYAYNNSQRICLYSPPSSGPQLAQIPGLGGNSWQAKPFLPDLTHYTKVADELVGGILCEKYTLDVKHGALGTMDDHISFFWDPLLEKPVRWHMHSRHVTFGSHTDEYIMDFISFQAVKPSTADLALPEECSQPKTADVAIQMFGTFLARYGKHYSSNEHSARNDIFTKNVKLVAELNRLHSGGATFKESQFLDMTKDEVMRVRGGKNKGTSRARRSVEQEKFVRKQTKSGVVLPKSFDWRTAKPGVVGPVKDQAACGSCWTYGVTEPIESIQAIRTGRLVELPEQFIVDCTWTNQTGDSGSNSGCDGGDSDIGALEVIRKFGGIVPTAKAYGSYLSVNGYCKDIRPMEVGAKLTGWVDIKDRDESGLLEALVTQGPINVNIMVPDEMLYYDSGVLNVSTCKYDSSQIDHAVVLTGYGTDADGTDYYVIRNSWSTYWGDDGYIKIARGEFDCCVSCEAGYPEIDSVARNDVVV